MKKILVTISLAFSLAIAYGQTAYDGRKLSGYLVNMVKGETFGPNKRTAQVPGKVCALMKLNEASDISAIADEYQCQMLDNIGDIYIMQIPVNQLGNLSLDSRVARIEAHEMPRPTMNDVPARIGAEKIWQGIDLPQAFTGDGVVCGIVDVGFDFAHPMFYDKDGKLRIQRYYDMNWRGDDGAYGVYKDDELLDIQHSLQATTQLHGTHTTSLMAGSLVNGLRDKYAGIAYGSDVAAAEVSLTSADLISSFLKIFQYADSLNQPCVINLSAGTPSQISDPLTLASEAINSLLGSGHILVASAGNEGSLYSTLKKTNDTSKLYASFVKATEIDSDNDDYVFECDLITEHPQEICFGTGLSSVFYVDSVIISTDSLDFLNGDTLTINFKLFKDTKIQAVKILEPSYPINGDLYHFIIKTSEILLEPLLAQMGEALEIVLSGDGACSLHVYSPNSFFVSYRNERTSEYADCFSNENSLDWPAELDDVIGVGSIKTKLNYVPLDSTTDSGYVSCPSHFILSSFSSWGPTWDNRIKPDVVAPGELIFGAYNQFTNTFETDKNQFFDVVNDKDGNEHYIIGKSGTSMSAPIVAGVIALWLQAKPDLTTEEIREVLARSCSHPDASEEYPNIRYGYGEIDAYAGLLHILDLPSAISELSMNQPTAVSFRLEGRRLSVVYADSGTQYDGDATLNIYTMDGRKVAATIGISIDLSTLNSGVYAVQLNSNQKGCTGSTLIRL